MSNASALYQQPDPVSLSTRPINKGMVLDLPSNALESGALLKASNFIVGKSGPYRRPVLVELLDATVDWAPVREIFSFWKADGTPVVCVLDSKFLYALDIAAGTLTGAYMTYSTGHASVTAAGTAVTGSGTGWLTDIITGDVLVFEPGTANEEALEIDAISGDTALTLKTAAAATHNTVDYEIRKALYNSDPYMVDWTFIPNKVVFADSQRYPISYDGTTFGKYSAGLSWVPTCVLHYADRLWFGRIVDGSTDYRSRFMWSKTTDKTDFGARFLDKPYTAGYMMRMVEMQGMMVSFFDDAVYLGRNTGITGDTLPVSFGRMDTAGIGLFGPKALVPWMDGIFWVGRDNVYFLNNNGNQAIGTPVIEEMLERCDKPWAIYAEADPEYDRVVFGFPEASDEIERVWSYDYKAGVWSYDEMACSMLRRATPVSSKMWSTWTGSDFSEGTMTATLGDDHVHGNSTTWQTDVILDGAAIFVDTDGDGVYETEYEVAANASSETSLTIVGTVAASFATKPYYIVQPANQWASIYAAYPTWFSIGAVNVQSGALMVGRNGKINVLSNTGTQDNDTATVEATIITPDMDEGYPDDDKTWIRFGLRIDRVLSVATQFSISYSLDAGTTWKSAGVISLAVGKKEGFVSFKATGSMVRFSVSTSTAVESFTIIEMTRRVVGRGVEVHTE